MKASINIWKRRKLKLQDLQQSLFLILASLSDEEEQQHRLLQIYNAEEKFAE